MHASVCVTSFNHEQFIEQALQSVLEQQTWFDFNVVVGLDLSTDQTPSVLERIAKQSHGRVIVHRRSSRIGVQSNFIRTVSEADGEFIAFLEGDDFWTDRLKLQKQVDFLIDHPQASFCCHRMGVFDNESGKTLPPQPTTDLPTLSSTQSLLVPSNPIHLGTVVTRRPYLDKFPDWFGTLKFPDLPLWFILSKKGRIGFIPEEMARYRLHSNSAFSSLSSLLKTAFVAQALLRIRSILDTGTANVVFQLAHDHARWFATEISLQAADERDSLISDVLSCDDSELSSLIIEALAEQQTIQM